MKNWLGMTAAELGRGIENGSIDPVTLTETYLAAIEAHPLKDRIYARVTADRARAEAAAAAARAGAGLRLHGRIRGGHILLYQVRGKVHGDMLACWRLQIID